VSEKKGIGILTWQNRAVAKKNGSCADYQIKDKMPVPPVYEQTRPTLFIDPGAPAKPGPAIAKTATAKVAPVKTAKTPTKKIATAKEAAVMAPVEEVAEVDRDAKPPAEMESYEETPEQSAPSSEFHASPHQRV
jgi:hypothetical protein